jgi:hypothetical protein
MRPISSPLSTCPSTTATRRPLAFSSSKISRMSSSMKARWGSSPARPRLPMRSGQFIRRAARRSRVKSRFREAGFM